MEKLIQVSSSLSHSSAKVAYAAIGSFNGAFLKLSLLVLLSSVSSWAAEATVNPAPKVDRILVLKSDRTLQLLIGGKVFRTYKVALGSQPIGPKEQQGDHKTPEGHYVIASRNHQSNFHLALRMSYPNASDRARAKKLGIKPGGDIMIHGIGNKYGWLGPLHRKTDWTDGCIAVTNSEIEEIWSLVRVGTAVEIRP